MVVTRRPLSTPVLVGRDDLLALGRRRAQAASDGAGHVLFLAGEAGIGKTRLLGAVAREAERHGMRLFSAAVFPRDLEVPGALLLDLAQGLTREADEERAAGLELLRRLRAHHRTSGDLHRRRRLLIMAIADRIAALATAQRPVMLALEDLHWADDLTLATVAHLARRIPSLPMLVVATYRSDELYPRVPMRDWRSRLLTQRLAEEARLARLTAEQTSSMAGLLLGGQLPAPADLVRALQARSDGIPLHVEEILAAVSLAPGTIDAAAGTVPDTITDAILLRRESLARTSSRVADAAAVIGRSFDFDLLAAVAGETEDRVSRAIDELLERYFIVRAPRRDWFEFRHALIRDALERSISVARRRELHERVARHAAARPELGDDAFLSGHFEAAGLLTEAHLRAAAAAGRAAGLSAHREALDLYRRATRCALPGLSASERARLIAARAAEEAATDDNDAAARSLAEARRLLLADGRHLAAADLLPPLVAARHLLGDDLAARVALLGEGLAEATSAVEDPRRIATEGRLEAGLSAAYMLDRRLDEAIAHGERATELAARAGDDATELNARTTLGAVLVFAGRMDAGWSMLEAAISRARGGRREAEAARAYRMIGTSASVLVEYERAEHWLRAGIEYAERTEQWNHRHYMASHLGHVLWATGAWTEAESVTRQALADGRGGITTRITALHVLGYLALGRGEWATAEATLDEARQLGEEMHELQRFSPAIWGLAEAALLQGRSSEAVALSEEGRAASIAVRDAAYLFPFLVTGTRARLAAGDPLAARRWCDEVGAALRERAIPGTLAAIEHAQGLLDLADGATGRARSRLSAARAGWQERGRAWEECLAIIDLGRASLRANRSAEAAAHAAEAAAACERIGSAALGSLSGELERDVRGRGGTTEAWAPLTAREYEVAQLIAEGRTNREIAVELTIAPKTVAAHVEHILDRLGANRRTEIATWVTGVRSAAAGPSI